MDPSKLTEHKIKSITGGATCEELTINARLVSTKKTQIKELHELINWRAINDMAALAVTLDKLVRNKWSDVVKMLRELLDALISLLRDAACRIPDKVAQANAGKAHRLPSARHPG